MNAGAVRCPWLVLGAFAFVAVTPTEVGAQNRSWLQQFGTFSYDGATALAADGQTSGFVGGITQGSLFGPSTNGALFLAKFDRSGSPVWGVQFGATYFGTAINEIEPAPSGGIFVAGLSAPLPADWNVWLARHDAQGDQVWIGHLGSSTFDGVEAIASDGKGGVFIGGYTFGVLVSPPPVGPASAWLARYEGDGRRLWLRQYESAKYGSAFHGASPDGRGGLFVAASGPMTGGAGDAWVARFDSDGDVTWGRRLGSAAADWAETTCPDGSGGVFVAGTTLGSLAAPHAGDHDGWVAHYDAAGNRLALMQFGTPAADRITGLAADAFGGAFLTGYTNGALGGPHGGLADAWIAHTQSGATLAWIRQFGTLHFDSASAIAPAGPGSAFVAGITEGFLLGSPSAGPHNGDAWLARYDSCYPDCNADGALTVGDFGCFQTRFLTADMYSDCSADGVLTVQDFGCFQTKFVVGCP